MSAVSEEYDRQRAELAALHLACEALAEREQRLLDFTEASGDWFWEQDASLRFTFLSVRELGRGARALTPRLGDPLLGRTRFEQALREPGDEAMWQRHAEDLAARRPFRDLTYRSRRGMDAPYWVRISGVPVLGRDGEFRGYRGVARDVTAEMEAARAAARQQALLRDTLDRLPVGICLYDPDRRLIWANRTYAVDAGLTPDAFRPGMSLTDVVRLLAAQGWYGEGDRETLVAVQLAIDRTRPSRWTRSGVGGRTFDVRIEPLADGGHVVCTVDVTALARAAAEAEAAGRAKSQFLATMSHELRTPLNAVIGFSEALMHESARPDRKRIEEYAGAINEAGRHLLALINDILDVARIEAGRMDLAEDPIDLARLAQTALRLLDPAARTASVSLEFAAPADLPAVRGDERRLRQVLLNLVSNAVKFTAAGGSVRLEAGVDADGTIVLRVADTGIGIAAQDLERVFQPFVQLDSSLARHYRGSGLGLFLSRALAVAHGGSLHLESAPGKGTTAVLRLPASRVLRRATAAQ